MKIYTTIAIASTALFAQANAHGFISDPPATYQDNTKKTSYDATMTDKDAPPCFQGKKWNDSPEKNTETFKSSYEQWTPTEGQKSLRALVEKFVPTCGNSMENGTRQDVTGKSTMHWENQDEGCGFVNSHHGPCEVWIDDTLVLHGDDCRAQYTGTPAEIPVDYSKCKGDCTLKFYWLALHEATWQIYKQCVPISNPGGQGPPSSDLAQEQGEQGPGQVYTEPEQEQTPAPEQKPEEQTPAPEQKPEGQGEYGQEPEQKPEETPAPAPEQKPEEQTPAPEQKPEGQGEYEAPEQAPVDNSPGQEQASPSPKMCEV
jgi:hypothetical protein